MVNRSKWAWDKIKWYFGIGVSKAKDLLEKLGVKFDKVKEVFVGFKDTLVFGFQTLWDWIEKVRDKVTGLGDSISGALAKVPGVGGLFGGLLVDQNLLFW